MTQETLLKTGNAFPPEPPTIPTRPPHSITLRDNVRGYLRQHLIQFDHTPPEGLYEWILSEIEPLVLEAALQYTRQNQSEAARVLGISRGNLRIKMRRYGFLKPAKTKSYESA